VTRGLRRRIFNSAGGFTLIELLITVLILAILVGIVVMTMNLAKGKAEETTCKANLRIAEGAINDYYADHHGVYPNPPGATPEEKAENLLDQLANDRYIKNAPRCPSGGQYQYFGEQDIRCSISSHNI